MINKLKVLGETVYEKEGNINPLGLNTVLQKANLIVLDFFLSENKCEFKEFDIWEFDQQRNKKVLYKNAPARSKSPFPTYSAFFDRDKSKCLKNIIKSYQKLNATVDMNAQINERLQHISKYINDDQNQDMLCEGIIGNLSTEDSNLITIRINGDFIADSSYFQPIIEWYKTSIDQEYYSKHNTISKGNNISCYVCGENASIAYGFCGTYKFYSANEFAYIAGGFQQNHTWKNYPVCPACANHLQIGRERISHSLNRNFYGNNYFLIPAPTVNRSNFYSTLLEIEEEFKELSLAKDQETNQQLRNELEEDIFKFFAKQKDQVTFTFFFYAASNSEFKILHEAEDILPSRFQKIISAKKKVEEIEEFKNLKGLYKAKEYHDLSFNFGIIKTFFHSDFNTDFLDITTKILKGRKISRYFVLHQISEHLARGFRQEKLFHDIKKAMIFLKFLHELELIDQSPGKMEANMDNKYEDYFLNNPDFYDADWKKAVFLTGVLSQHVMDIQRRIRGATPFRSRLNGLKLDHKIIKRLLPESIEKLEQYKSNYYHALEEVISKLMESGEPELKQQSVDEISFYFAMGMNLNKQFKSKKEPEGENNE